MADGCALGPHFAENSLITMAQDSLALQGSFGRHDPLARLEDKLGYRFSNRALLEEAITHVSYKPPAPESASTSKKEHKADWLIGDRPAQTGALSYQRLEFLGDRVLGLVVSTMLFEAFQEAPEGELSKRLADLVRKESCADVAREWNLGDHLRMGEGEKRSGARKKDAFLGDSCEAVIGAVYRDGGMIAADTLVRKSWEQRMHAPRVVPKDAKTMVQEIVQAHGLPVPVYRDIGRTGPDHAPQFEIAVVVEGYADAFGRGTSKRLAERAAAESWLKREGMDIERAIGASGATP